MIDFLAGFILGGIVCAAAAKFFIGAKLVDHFTRK